MNKTQKQVQLAKQLARARGLSTRIGDGNVLTMLRGVRALRAEVDITSSLVCACEQGACKRPALYRLVVEGGVPVFVCERRAARLVYGRARWDRATGARGDA